MSDYANLREAYYILLNTPPDPPPPGLLAMMDHDREVGGNRNPDPEIEPALMLCRTQAEWFAVQDALSAEEPTAAQTELLAEVRGRAAPATPPPTQPVTPPPEEPPVQ